MPVPELPHSVSDHPLDCYRKTTKSIDELCSDLNKLHERIQLMYNYMVKQLQNFRLQIQPLGPFSGLFNPDHDLFQGITLVFREMICERNQTMYNYIVAKLQNVKLQMKYIVNILDLHKVTSKNIFVSDDLNPDLDPVQAIAPVFSENSKFFTPLQRDIEPGINKPNSKKIVISSNLLPDPLDDLASREIVVSYDLAIVLDPVESIAPVFSENSKSFTPLQCDIEPEVNKSTSRNIDVSSNLSPDPSSDLASRKIVVSSDLDPDPSAGLNFTRVIAQGFNKPFILNSSWRDFERIDEEQKLSSQLWYAGQKRVWIRMAGKFMTTHCFVCWTSTCMV